MHFQKFVAMAEEEISEEQYAEEFSRKQVNVKSLLKSGDRKGALEAALRKAPLGSKSGEVKVSYPWRELRILDMCPFHEPRFFSGLTSISLLIVS